jgi:hypothetical protein
MIQQRTQPHQVGPLFLGRNNLGIVDAISQHPDLIFQHLESGIVTWHEKPRQKNENHVKHTRKTVHIRLNPIGLILLSIKGLRGGIRFRTPLKLKELENLPKQSESSHPKAGSGAAKIRREWLGLENCPSSLFHPERTPGWKAHPIEKFVLPSNRADHLEFERDLKRMATDDPDRLVRTRAAEFLGLTGAADPAPILFDILKDCEDPVEVNLILNTAVLLRDSAGIEFDMTHAEGAAWTELGGLVPHRVSYLRGGTGEKEK